MNHAESTDDLTLRADLFLVHAPSVYDFRERDDVLFAYLSDSDSVNVTSIFEMYPLGFLSIQRQLANHGFDVKIVNLASLMLQHPGLQVEQLLARLEAPVFGLDLHWMAHCHGSIEVAGLIKKAHPDSLVIFGGLSATYFADELIRYPAVDVVFQGYDTLAPITQFMETIRDGSRRFEHIPNLVYKASNGEPASTGFTHKPQDTYSEATIDWSFYARAPVDPRASRLIMTLPNSGCQMNCPWCGGSRYAYQNIMGVQNTLVRKDHDRIVRELQSLGDVSKITSIYALQCYSESRGRLFEYLDTVQALGIPSVHFEHYVLPDEALMQKMAKATRAFILLSPESHDRTISRLAGRGAYSMEDMEAWIPRALGAGVAGIMVWFFIGMPGQTAQSVMDTVRYCERLLDRFPGKNVIPLICPMVPFLDPGSRLFEEPQKHGYRLFHRTLADHRQAMVAPVWHRRLNYETIWMSRREIQEVTYQAIGELVAIKAERGQLPGFVADSVRSTIEETTALLEEVEWALALDRHLSGPLRDAIRAYNRKILAYSSDQIIPTQRPFGNRWFDDFTVPKALLDRICLPN